VSMPSDPTSSPGADLVSDANGTGRADAMGTWISAPTDAAVDLADAPAAVSYSLEGQADIEGRSLFRLAIHQLRKDKGAMVGLVIVAFVVLCAVFAPVICAILGVDPYKLYASTVNPNLAGIPLFGPKILSNYPSGITAAHPFGVEPGIGRDVLARIVYGARVSLIFALVATAISVVLGTVVGVAAGFFGGAVDAVLAFVMDVLLAFPFLLFIIAVTPVLRNQPFLEAHLGTNGNGGRVSILILIVGFFGFPYFGRIIRGQVYSLREKEFIDAAKVVGASTRHILFRQMLPNLAASIIVYSALVIPTNVVLEATLSYLGVGVDPPTPSWGRMLNDAVAWYQVTPTFLLIPGIALFITVLGFNLFGDGLRDVLDPRTTG